MRPGDLYAQRAALAEAFKAWASASGYRVVRRVDCLSAIGECSIRIRKGRVSVVVARELAPEQAMLIAAGALHGYDYPIDGVSVSKALEFFARRPQ